MCSCIHVPQDEPEIESKGNKTKYLLHKGCLQLSVKETRWCWPDPFLLSSPSPAALNAQPVHPAEAEDGRQNIEGFQTGKNMNVVNLNVSNLLELGMWILNSYN